MVSYGEIFHTDWTIKVAGARVRAAEPEFDSWSVCAQCFIIGHSFLHVAATRRYNDFRSFLYANVCEFNIPLVA